MKKPIEILLLAVIMSLVIIVLIQPILTNYDNVFLTSFICGCIGYVCNYISKFLINNI